MFKEDLFYNPEELADCYDLQEVKEVADTYEIPCLQQQDVDEWSNTDSEFNVTNVHDMEDIQEEEESPHDQEQSIRNSDNNDFLPGAFPDDTKLLTKGLEPILPTLNITLEPSNPTTISDLPKASKVQKPRDTTQGMQDSNI